MALLIKKTKSIQYKLEVTIEDSDALVLHGLPDKGEQSNVNYQACTSFRAFSEEMDSLSNNLYHRCF